MPGTGYTLDEVVLGFGYGLQPVFSKVQVPRVSL